MIEGQDLPKREITVTEIDQEIKDAVYNYAGPKLKDSIIVDSKITRSSLIKNVYKETLEEFAEKYEEQESDIAKSYESLLKELVRNIIVKDKTRLDSRDYTTVRNIDIDVSFLSKKMKNNRTLYFIGRTKNMGKLYGILSKNKKLL